MLIYKTNYKAQLISLICILLMVLINEIVYSQSSAKFIIKLDYTGNLGFPCDDGEGDYYYSTYNKSYDCSIKIDNVDYELNSIYDVNGNPARADMLSGRYNK